RPDKPISPCPCFVVVSKVHEGQERKGGVAQPAISVIPVPRTAQALGKRRRGGRNDSARWGVGQSLQRDERPLDRVRPRPDLWTPVAPLAPEGFRPLQCREGIDRRRSTSDGSPVRKDEGNGL